ncbi:hypothetical protein BGW80DRAFT_1324003 [Lactifluus volemus]|nr:hypothetical protein BGW80DRAFT_1324003 [Lactifluus volemus]
MWLTDMQKIGVGLTSFGALFMLLGVMLFFDGAILALGNMRNSSLHFHAIYHYY